MQPRLWVLLLLFVLPGSAWARPDSTCRADEFLRLIERRLHLSVEVARFKWNTGRPIDDPDRENELLERLVAARGQNVEEERVRRFFQAQIEASKQVQRALHEEWRSVAQPPFGSARDLGQLRPELDAVSSDLLRCLEQAPAGASLRSRARVLWGDRWSQAQETSLAPFLQPCRP
jgi:chorismate mutase